MICLLMLGLLCNWVLLYAVAYAYLGLIDGERADNVSLFFDRHVDHARLWRCSPFNGCAICCGIGSIAWVYLDGLFYRDVRRIVQAAVRGDFPVLKLGAKNRKAAEQSPARQVRHYVHRFAPVVARSISLTLLSSAGDLQFHDRQA